MSSSYCKCRKAVMVRRPKHRCLHGSSYPCTKPSVDTLTGSRAVVGVGLVAPVGEVGEFP
eukprot:6099042-Pyramimonas_sp.AAC.1